MNNKSCSTLIFSAAALSGFVLISTAYAADMPKRKSGLWEIKTLMKEMPGGGMTMQHCVDEKTDDLMQRDADKQAKQSCTVSNMKRDGDRMTVQSACKMDKSTVTTDSVFTGKFDSAYRVDMKSRYEPPLHGMKENAMSMEAKWLGACKPGQKPGDMVMQGMPGMPKGMKFNPSQMPAR